MLPYKIVIEYGSSKTKLPSGGIDQMFEIVTKKMLGPKVFLMDIVAPLVAGRLCPDSS